MFVAQYFNAEIYPKSMTVYEGQNMHLLCYSRENIKALFEGEPVPSNVFVRKTSQNQHKIIITNAKRHNSGKYQCYGKSEFPFDKDNRDFGRNVAFIKVTSKCYTRVNCKSDCH